MRFEICEESLDSLEEYARVSIAFEVCRVIDVERHGNGEGGFSLSERELDVPFTKDYDAIDGPAEWAKSSDISNWALFCGPI